MDPTLVLEIKTPEFFLTPLKKLRVESCDVANRTYILNKAGRIVAVGKPKEA